MVLGVEWNQPCSDMGEPMFHSLVFGSLAVVLGSIERSHMEATSRNSVSKVKLYQYTPN